MAIKAPRPGVRGGPTDLVHGLAIVAEAVIHQGAAEALSLSPVLSPRRSKSAVQTDGARLVRLGGLECREGQGLRCNRAAGELGRKPSLAGSCQCDVGSSMARENQEPVISWAWNGGAERHHDAPLSPAGSSGRSRMLRSATETPDGAAFTDALLRHYRRCTKLV